MAIINPNVAVLSGLVEEYAPEHCSLALQASSPLFKDESVIEKTKGIKGELVFDVFPSESTGGGMIADFGALPVASGDLPGKGRVMPQAFIEVVGIGRSAADLEVSSDNLVTLFKNQIGYRSASLARKINVAIYGVNPQPLAGTTWSAVGATGTAAVTFADGNGFFRPGAAYDFCDLSSGNTYVVRCGTSTPTGNASCSVVFFNDVPSPGTLAIANLTDTTIATGDTFRIRGAGGTGFGATTAVTGFVNFDAIAGSGANATLHGIAPASLPGWTGQNRTLSGAAFSQEASLGWSNTMNQVSNVPWTHILCGAQVSAAIQVSGGIQGSILASGGAATQVGGAGRFDLGVMNADKYQGMDGSRTGLTLHGRPVIEDPNCGNTVVIYHNKNTTKLGMWKDLGPAQEGNDSLLLDRATYSFSTQIDARVNLYTIQRSSVGMLTNVGAL